MKLFGNPKFLVGAVGSFGGANVIYRYTSTVEGDDQFAIHTAQQHVNPMRFMSGLHSPFFAPRTNVDSEFYNKHFSDYKRLINLSANSFQEKSMIRTPVSILPMSSCPLSSIELEVRLPIYTNKYHSCACFFILIPYTYPHFRN